MRWNFRRPTFDTSKVAALEIDVAPGGAQMYETTVLATDEATAGDVVTGTVAVDGATVGDSVLASPSGANDFPPGVVVHGRVSAADTVTLTALCTKNTSVGQVSAVAVTVIAQPVSL